jgi:hypothetical protein
MEGRGGGGGTSSDVPPADEDVLGGITKACRTGVGDFFGFIGGRCGSC